MARQTVFRADSPGAKEYTIISNKLLQDPNISRETKGLICELISRPYDWDITVGGMLASGKEGKHKIYKMLKEAKAAGYIVNDQSSTDGKRSRQTYAVSDDPEYLAKQYAKIATDINSIREQNAKNINENNEASSFSENQEVRKSDNEPSLTENRKVTEEDQPSLTDFSLPNFSLPKNRPQQSKDINKQKKETNSLSQTDVCDSAGQRKKTAKKIPYTQYFDEFWKVYSACCKKRDSAPGTKSEAFTEWNKLDTELIEAARRGLKAYVRDCDRAGQSLKHCCRYLKHRAWEGREEQLQSDQAWWQHPKVGMLGVEVFRTVLDEYKPNGIWPEQLGPPPGAEGTAFRPEIVEHFCLQKYDISQVKS